MEQHYPMLFERYALREGSGGAGEHRGGFGVNYRIRLRRGEARVSMVMDHGRVGPPGLAGGGDGGAQQGRIIRDGVDLRAAAPLQGPGHRDPRRRRHRRARRRAAAASAPRRIAPARVARDVARGYYSADEAAAAFGARPS